MAEAYVCKVTSVGQVTLPKEVREKLGVGEDDYVIIENIGETYFIKKLNGEKQLLARVRAKVKKSGITRERLEEIVKEETQVTWGEDFKRLR